jgi:hypothetical protein
MGSARRNEGSIDAEKAGDEHVEQTSVNNYVSSPNLEVDEDSLPPDYFKSRFFVGSMMGIGLGLMGGVASFAYAAPILGIINAEIGPVSLACYPSFGAL